MYDRKRAKARRIKLGLSVGQLAARADISERAVYAYEAGDRTPGVDAFVNIAAALRIPSNSLWNQAKTDVEFTELYRAEMARRKDPNAVWISTHEDAENAVLVDGIRAARRKSERG